MVRYLALVFVVVFPITLAMICGFSFSEALIILVLATISLGFIGWMVVEKFRAGFFRCLVFWWISKLLDKPELIYPE